MRMIDADRLSDSIYDNVSTPYEEAVAAKEDCLCEIENAPTVDAVPVVYCKDCKYRTEFGNCGHPRQQGILPTAYPYDFCSYGERKDETNES